MESIKNIVLQGARQKPIATDVFFSRQGIKKPVIIYAHGFNGFKDWGDFDRIAQQFAEAGFVFIKFNFSYNGTSPSHPAEFVDLEAFGNNNYSLQQEDLEMMIDWIVSDSNPYAAEIDHSRIGLIGHSMGGGSVLIYAATDLRISMVVTWAAVSQSKTPWGNWPTEKLAAWKEQGVQYYLNGRTNQQMPLYYQLFEDYQANKENLDICSAIGKLEIPVLICHGTSDDAVPVEQAYHLKLCKPDTKLFTVNSDHVFGRRHPWTETEWPVAMQAVLNATLHFFQEHSQQKTSTV